ncbi:hypothetical protein BDZ89DRAFT_1152577 [Hymenopellis radicata]|nr:hypothetical protein BDZ89DRAFT_1152577 [Hymenopellis radicata]
MSPKSSTFVETAETVVAPASTSESAQDTTPPPPYPPSSQPINPIPPGFPLIAFTIPHPARWICEGQSTSCTGVHYRQRRRVEIYFYPIVVGLKVGIVTDANEASTLTNGVTGGFFKKCHCQSAAIAYYNSALAEGKVRIGPTPCLASRRAC